MGFVLEEEGACLGLVLVEKAAWLGLVLEEMGVLLGLVLKEIGVSLGLVLNSHQNDQGRKRALLFSKAYCSKMCQKIILSINPLSAS